ncbi:MAG: putative ABC transporter ATP-binding protein [Candidatus Accumulibacter sp. BA-94]|uniref:ABC transporter ATP-binding protein n=1 Tax=Accumulibacter sp. TaxID=2053492 RepID=UPI00044D869C|nr:ATP-binding cassette domain-containing protein [Accumulibacter sp.]EXI82046.1 MAG: putative ABC transporter ATP-binding protein [Candidatus Accumulibacter sp. BA-94]HRD87191.1 ATP-binding cassette domain-containing protein [Accumulibacter sp.]
MISAPPTAGRASPTVIEIRGLCTQFDDLVVHRDIDLDIEAGQMLGLVGGSGSGKTTLLREMVGLLAPSSGTVRMFGQSVLDTDAQRRRALRRRFGMLFQQGALFSALSVFDNIAFPLRELHTLDEEMVADLVFLKLAMVELEARHARLMPAELSGGMVKRVALARALSLEPELLVLDEPTAGLDPDRSESFVKLLRMLQRELGFTVVMVTHDPETLAGLATRLAVLADQRIVACGTAAEVAAVDHPFVRNFFGSGRAAAAIRQRQS